MNTLREAVEADMREAATDNGARTDLVLGEYVVIAAAHGFDDEGETISQVVISPHDGSESRILGLLHHARVRLEADILDEGSEQ